MRTIDKIITKVNCKFGAPSGRRSIKPIDYTIEEDNPRVLIDNITKEKKTIFDCAVPMSDSYYDKGGAYWGSGRQLRVSYTKDLSYINFYRV